MSCPTNLNALLSDIHLRYVQIKDQEFQVHYQVIDQLFQLLHQRMKDVDPYYRRYSSTIQFVGSHYDNVRVTSPDEFDLSISIGLPVNLNPNPSNPAQSDVLIEPKSAGYVQLRMGTQFQNLHKNVSDWPINRTAYEWMDGSNYLLRSKFMNWFKGVVSKALNTISATQPQLLVNGVVYTIRKSESGPAMTLIVENIKRGFKLDVDLVPALRFPESRWPVGSYYRSLHAARGDWLLVAKAVKNGSVLDQSRSWRIARPNQERQLIHNSGNARQAWRLVKKVRDALNMNKLASYYIKNLFFREIHEVNIPNFWHKNNPADLFKLMIGRLYTALVNKKITYFWNKNENLLAHIESGVLVEYAARLRPLVHLLAESPQEYKRVAKYILSPEEFIEYNARFLRI